VSLLVAGGGIIIVPWALALVLVYGKAYVGAAGATSLALATAVVHMGSGSASSRLSILSLASVSVLRERLPAFTVGLTLIMALLWIGTVALLIRLGKRRYWLPSPEMLTRFLHHLPFRRLSRK
jgi:hypothetical protein